MKKIRINAKSAPIYEELITKINAGFKHIEIQLITEEVSEQGYIDTRRAIEEYGADISVVHTPLITEKNGEISLDGILNSFNYYMFMDTCKYAQFIGDLEDRRIKVVVHNDFAKDVWQNTNLLEEKIAKRLKIVLDVFTRVDIVIENSIFADHEKLRTVFDMEDVSYTVNVLNSIIEGNRFMPLMDTCHMMMNWEGWRRISGEDLVDWEDAFRKASIYGELGLMHLNNMRINGFGNDHGVAFDKNNSDDMKKLDTIMACYLKYADCEISIEVREDDYLSTPENLLKTKESLELLGYDLDIG